MSAPVVPERLARACASPVVAARASPGVTASARECGFFTKRLARDRARRVGFARATTAEK